MCSCIKNNPDNQDSVLKLNLDYVISNVQDGAEAADVSEIKRQGSVIGYIVTFADGRELTLLNKADDAEGSAAAQVVTGLSEDAGSYWFELEGGEKVALPKCETKPFKVEISGDEAEITDGGTLTASYKVTGADDKLEVKVMAGEGWSAEVTESSASEGTVKVTAPNPISADKVLVSFKDGAGRQQVRALRLTTKSSVQRGNIETYAYCGVGYRLTDPNKWPREKALERYSKVTEGGVQIMTSAIFDGWGFDEVKYQLDLAAETGVKLAVYVEHYGGEQLRDFINMIKDHPGLWGYQMFDEANADEFARMYKTRQFIRSIDPNPDHPFMVNVGGDGGTFGPYGSYHADNYGHYIERLVNEAHVDFISFDYYPCIEDYVAEDDWFSSIQTVSDKAEKYGIPFWAYCCTCRFQDSYGLRCLPCVASLRLQDYTNLAYGAQGLEYFTWDAAGDNMSDWPLSVEGEINPSNPTFEYLKFVNEEVQRRAYVFDGCDLQWVALYKEAPEGIRLVDESKIPDEIASVYSDRPLTMSLIENDGGRSEYFNIVSRTHLRSTPLHLRFKYPVQTVERDGSLKSLNPGDYDFTLDPGDILIIKTK